MSFLPSRLAFTGSSRVASGAIGVVLIGLGIGIYLSPAAHHGKHTIAAPRHGGPVAAAAGTAPSPTATPSGPSVHPKSSTSSGKPGTGSPRTVLDVVRPPAKTDVDVVKTPGAERTRTRTSTIAPALKHCWDFRWQQDAQAAYAANLSDPAGLDGAAGPYNGDGLACTQLPVDPSRPKSTPIGAYVAPKPADKSSLVNPAKKYFGIAEDGLPGDTSLLNTLDKQTGKAPSAIEWFSYWDTDYEASKVQTSWSRGALPVITWMSVANKSTSPGADQYTLANIVAGKFDSYLLRYAGAILKTGLPVAIRLDQEMNGNWYPWSAGFPANQAGSSDAPNLYVQAWRHVWNIFNNVGANADVIWTWTPVRVDTITPGSTTSGSKYETSLQEDYPGDKYVDWVGASAYQYKPSDGWSYETTFSKTIDQLSALTSKPIFIAETGATESVSGTDYAAEKATWTSDTLAGLASNPNIVGFTWFNNSVDDVHQVDGVSIQTDWQFSSSPQALAAFKKSVANSRYASGVMPDGGGGNS